MKWLHRNKVGQMILFIIGVIIIPNVIEEIVTRAFDLYFENPIWYEVVDTSVMLAVSIPLFWWMISKLDLYVGEMETLVVQKRKINDELRERNAKLAHMAYFDELTGLPNREKLLLDLQEWMEAYHAGEKKTKIAIALLDLDRFQQINDTMGYQIGDALIQQVAERLQKFLPPAFSIYRHMGDEFSIIAEIDSVPLNVLHQQKPFPGIFTEPYYIQDEEIFATASAGVTVFPDQGEAAEVLIKQADQALSVAKAQGGNMHQLFEPEMAAAALRRLKLENGLRTAVEQKELVLHYQPQIDLQTNAIVGVEALIRWEHPEFGLIPPNEFIPLAEETGSIIPIGKWVVETACRQMKAWHELGFDDLSVAINVSIKQLRRFKFPSFVEQVLKETGLAPDHLEIEITESMMQDIEESKRIFKELKHLGLKISIDDFGTGYASLSVLGSLEIDYLKIDQAFTREMESNSKMKSIVKTIVQLGSNLGVDLIAEGIETEEQAASLKAYECRYGQGYLYSKPLPAIEVEQLLAAHKQSYAL